MSIQDEKLVFKWTDQLDVSQAEVGDIEVGGVERDDERLALIKARTFAKLGLSDTGITISQVERSATSNSSSPGTPVDLHIRPVKRSNWKMTLAASILAIVLIASVALVSPEVRAQVRKVIQFIPGFATVQQFGDDHVRYVLPTSIVKMFGEGRLEIRGIQIGDKLSQISITGSRVPSFKSLELVNDKGDRYAFGFSTLQYAREWMGGYYYRGPIRITDGMELVIPDVAERIPVTLEHAGQADRIEDLGSTAIMEGISLTAVTAPVEGERVKVTLISQLPPDSRLETYGFGPYDYMDQPRLTSESGQELTIHRDAAYPGKNEFYYDPIAEQQAVKLNIPSMLLDIQMKKPLVIRVPIPADGQLDVHKQVSILGFPVDIVKTERVRQNQNGLPVDNVRVYFDPRYDVAAAQSLLMFNVEINGINGGYETKFDEATGAIEFMEFPIQPENKKQYSFTVKEGQVLYRGPWQLEWASPAASLAGK